MKNNKIIFKFTAIEEVVCNHFGIEKGELWNSKRIQNTAEARQVFYYISYYINDCVPHKKIAEYTGQTRPNAIRSVKKVNSLMDVDSHFETEVTLLYNYCKKHLKQV